MKTARHTILVLSTPDIADSWLMEFLAEQPRNCTTLKLGQELSDSSTEFASQLLQWRNNFLLALQKQWFQVLPKLIPPAHQEKLTSSLHKILNSAPADNIAVHDPTIVHSLPQWLNQAGFETSLVFEYSEPQACALALQKTWRFPLSFAFALWEYYVLSAVRHLNDPPCSLVTTSHKQLLTRSNQPLDMWLNQLDMPMLKTWRGFSQDNSATESDNEVTAPTHLQEMYEALEHGRAEDLIDQPLSVQSADILQYYGQLRAGFGLIKAERDHFRNLVRHPDNCVTGVQGSGGDEDLSHKSQPLDSSDQSTMDQQLIRVHVTIAGMQSIELYAEQDSPVVDMLHNYLANTNVNEIVYLNCGLEPDDTLYFMSADLVGLETYPA